MAAQSLPSRERELKLFEVKGAPMGSSSLPSRERELKQLYFIALILFLVVAPLAGA